MVFLTGQREVNILVRKLRTAFPLKQKKQKMNHRKNNQDNLNAQNSEEESDLNLEEVIRKARRRSSRKVGGKILPNVNLDE